MPPSSGERQYRKMPEGPTRAGVKLKKPACRAGQSYEKFPPFAEPCFRTRLHNPPMTADRSPLFHIYDIIIDSPEIRMMQETY